ncbi:MAG: hypothetical protein V1685_02095, partial [Parcubacteria group bacterium]
IGSESLHLWFSSSRFFVVPGSWLHTEAQTPTFWRMYKINQLGLLVPDQPPGSHPDSSISFGVPPFSHSRGIHSILPAAMAEVLLSRAGFPEWERIPFVLTVLYHDCATPVGGDSVKRMDPIALSEETNFARVLELSGLSERWRRDYGFNLEQASSWVRNEGTFGLLLDILDKMSYVALDCYALGYFRAGLVRDYCLEHPLFMDVWEDILFTHDRKRIAFRDPERLFTFLLARAYEHQELLHNPYSRIFDFTLTRIVREYYLKGNITRDNLITWGPERFEVELAQRGQSALIDLMEPDEYEFKRFDTAEELHRFCRLIGGDHVDHVEYIRGCNPCLDWPVFTDPEQRTGIVPLWQLLPQRCIDLIVRVSQSRKGHYAYWRKTPERSQ